MVSKVHFNRQNHLRYFNSKYTSGLAIIFEVMSLILNQKSKIQLQVVSQYLRLFPADFNFANYCLLNYKALI